MKKIISLVFLSIFFFNNVFAEKYWSNVKDGPTTVREAETFIFNDLIEDIPKDSPFEYPQLYGIWYSHQLGFVAIHEEKYKSGIYKMRLVKAPFGYGTNNTSGFDSTSVYKDSRAHEGTIEATIIKVEGEYNVYTIYSKVWFENDDGSYRYETWKGKLIKRFGTQFEISYPENSEKDGQKEYFNKISPRQYKILEVLKKIDSSKEISDFEIQSYDKGLFIYFDTKDDSKGEIRKEKFIDLSANGDVYVGELYRNLKDNNDNGITFIRCNTNSSMEYRRVVNKNNVEQKFLKKKCDPLKITYSTYQHYIYRYIYYGSGAFLLFCIIFYFIKRGRKIELSNWNKKNNKTFKSYSELAKHKENLAAIKRKKEEKRELEIFKKEDLERKKREKEEEKKRIQEEKKLKAEEKRREKIERTPSANEESSSDLGASLKRLKKMYNDGHLSKVEFEKAKNKLLK